MALGIACIAGVFIIGNTLKEGDLNPNKFKIKTYDCALNSGIEERMKEKYGDVQHSISNPRNFFSVYHKPKEVVIIAVMYVGADFCEDEFVQFMKEIPEVTIAKKRRKIPFNFDV